MIHPRPILRWVSMFKAAFALLAIALIASVFAFDIVPSRNLHEARMVFFATATLFVPLLLVALIRHDNQ
jgi:uncharacterized membrane protein YtjA (UPF0391 family)